MPITRRPGSPSTPVPSTKGKEDNIPGIKPSPANDSFARKFNNTEANDKGAFNHLPPGTYNALITEAQMVRDGKKESAYIECTVVGDEKEAGRVFRIYWNFSDDEGNDKQGMPYFRANLAMLGHDEDLESWEHAQNILSEIAQQNVWVIVNVKKKGQWTNYYLSEVPENQDIKPSLG